MPILKNWNSMFKSCPQKIFTPKNVEELKSVLLEMIGEDRRIRVVGPARHTWGDLSMSNDVVINMKKFNKVVSHTIPPHIDVQKISNDTHYTVTVQGGVILEDLLKFCVKHNVMIKNMGAIDKQTVAGVFSTGTHGSTTGDQPQTFSDQVTSIKMMLSDGSVQTFSKNSDDWNALMCGLGYFGIILELTLEVVPIYDIHEVNQRYSLNDLGTKQQFTQWLDDLMTSNDHLELIYFPTDNDVIVRKRIKVQHSSSVGSRIKNWWNPVADNLTGYVREFFTKVGNRFPSTVPTLLRIATKQIVKTKSERTLRADVLFINNTLCHYNTTTVIDQEFSAPYSEAYSAFYIAKDLVDSIFKQNRGAVFSFRFDPGNDSCIGTSTGRKTIFLEVQHMTNSLSPESLTIYKNVENTAYNEGWRTHWGKYNGMNKQLLQSLYPQSNVDKFMNIKNKLDPKNVFGNEYLDSVFML
ncbi:FAD-binding protein [Yasminevirus sp. GU-2018]|uniref:FAD-binding protein n=1 Tax=Yasminevirus sp. GU-2018 TaxID=2420051 RepID=A0A5K0U9H1_9VIRU|nr:FAD-binding protein [Yasminevirus sp. GU-2018]